MDPETIAGLISTAVGIIKGLLDANATEQWQNSVSGKLDTIITQNATIIAILEQLPLLWDADLQKNFNEEAVKQGIALCNDFDQYMAAQPPDLGQIKSIRTDAETLANNIVLRGPCVYQGANALAVLVLAIHKMLRVDRGETQKLVDNVLSHMQIWAGNTNGMFGKAISDTQGLLNNAQQTLAHEPRGQVAIYSVQTEVQPIGGGPGGGMRPSMLATLSVIAEIEIDDNNLTFYIRNAKSTWFDTDHLSDDVVAGQVAIWSRRLQGEVNTIKAIKSRLDTLQKHETALEQMIGSLQKWE